MQTFKWTVWQLLVEAMVLTSMAAMLALVLSALLALLIRTLVPVSRSRERQPGKERRRIEERMLDKTLRCLDQLLTCAFANCSY